MKGKNLAKIINVLSAAALGTMLSVSSIAHADEVKTKSDTTTPIKHVVVIFGENVSFDHYFGTYPYALNVKGEPQFFGKANTPEVNNLLTPKDYNGTQPGISKTNLITNNPNSANPVRLDRSQPITADMDHDYHDEMAAVDGGKMDQFVGKTGSGSNMVMDYYDGNTVTALWNYAQNFAMSDNSFGTTYGPSTPGALNLVSGETHGATLYDKNGQPVTGDIFNAYENRTVTGDPNPHLDTASTGQTVTMDDTNKNVGDLLNTKGITWGWFQGGFADPTHKSTNVGGAQVTDYSPHHEPFQYYKSTANPNHVAPSSSDMIGKTDQANHQYDINDFWKAVDKGNMPSVSYLKAPMYQDGHAGYSDPLDEQKFIVDTINHLEQTPEWKDTAVILSYDDSDGWYDHVYGPNNGQTVESGKAGYGPRLPLLVVSPFAKSNFVDHTVTDQSSILKFIEDNWQLGRIGGTSLDAQAGSLNNMFDFTKGPSNQKLFLDANSGEVVKQEAVTNGNDNSEVKKGWVKAGNQWNYLDQNGAMKKGWVNDGGKWYYLDQSGDMKTGWVKDGANWYYLNQSGAMQTGWIKDGKNWYYLNQSGAMQTGWVKVGAKWYFLYKDGHMASNTTIGGYKVNASGEWTK